MGASEIFCLSNSITRHQQSGGKQLSISFCYTAFFHGYQLTFLLNGVKIYTGGFFCGHRGGKWNLFTLNLLLN